MARPVYEKLATELKRLSSLSSISALLSWDQLVMLPSKGASARADQMAAFEGLLHRERTSPSLGALFSELSGAVSHDDLDEFEKANITLSQRDYDRATKVPQDLAEERAKLASEGYETWLVAKKASDFSLFAPIFQKSLALKLQIAKLIDPKNFEAGKPYDALLDDYERGMTTAELDPLFEQIKKDLIPMIRKVTEAAKQGKVDASFLVKEGAFDLKKQEKLSRRIVSDLGFDLKDAGRLDVSVHPFSMGLNTGDVRITTKYRDSEFLQALAGTIHETGHGLYEQGLNKKFEGLPVAQAVSMGIHESQSLLWERHVGLSHAFWSHYWPLIASEEYFGSESISTEKQSVDAVFKAVNSIDPNNTIRIEADELTYPLHVILRYEIEKGLVEGTLAVDDVPRVWNEKMQDYLNVTPASDAKGCLQDVHWSDSSLGYFPTYLLGAMCACQIWNKLKSCVPDVDAKVARGEFAEIKAWLNDNVHKYGSVHLPSKLMEIATGERLNASYFITYLKEKYSRVYDIEL